MQPVDVTTDDLAIGLDRKNIEARDPIDQNPVEAGAKAVAASAEVATCGDGVTGAAGNGDVVLSIELGVYHTQDRSGANLKPGLASRGGGGVIQQAYIDEDPV